MKKIDQYLLGETVRDCTKRFKSYLPAELRPRLDDLLELVSDLEAIEGNTMTDKGMKSFEGAFARLSEYYKNNKKIPWLFST